MTWADELGAIISGAVLTDEVSRRAFSTDFGRIFRRIPAAVVRPASSDEVAAVVQFASAHGLRLAPRGSGHSQNGQSLSEQIVLDLTGLNQVTEIDTERGAVTCEAGITWRELLRRVMPFGLSPPVLTNNLDVTVGGTLSTGGLGVASWKYGTQADQCTELEVVTGGGRIVKCSPTVEKELFDAVRAGLGRFGAITAATLTLRKHRPEYQSFHLLYDSLPALLNDLLKLMEEESFDYLESWAVALPQGFRETGGVKRPYAEWFYPLHCTVEIDGPTSKSVARSLAGLSYYRHVHTESGPVAEFFSRLDPLFHLWKAGGFWERAHPWVEGILPWPSAGACVSALLEQIPPAMLAGGHILLWPARGRATSAPMLMRPQTDSVLGFGILPAVPESSIAGALPLLREANNAIRAAGGKRYLSGWIDFDRHQWEAHYGDQLPVAQQLKERFDPLGLFPHLLARQPPLETEAREE